MISQYSEKKIFYCLAFISAVAVTWIDFRAAATFDQGDGLQHYLISHYSWKHPGLLLDLWGKPFFTLISSPFSQFGLRGMIVFQSLCAFFISVFSYQIGKKLNISISWLAPIFIFFSPVFFSVINSGLTEIFFGFMFMLSLWLVFMNRFILSAVVASFIPFVRPEGYIVIILLAIVFLLKRRISALPFLLMSFILYTIIGYFYYSDIFWIITNNYSIEQNYETKGSFFHYFLHYDEIWGLLYSILIIGGIIRIFYSVYQRFFKSVKYPFLEEQFFLILGTFAGCLVLHCLLNSVKGILNNLGLIRYMAVLIPASGLLALIGLNSISLNSSKKYFYPKLILLAAIVFIIVREPFKQWYYPFRLNNEQLVLNEAGKWFDTVGSKNKTICYLHPYFAVACNIDAFDEKNTLLMWSMDDEQIDKMPEGSIIFWDSHFSPLEGRTPLEELLNDKRLTATKHFSFYDEPRKFDVWIFIRKNPNEISNNNVPTEIVKE